jgi:hypothetical protein
MTAPRSAAPRASATLATPGVDAALTQRIDAPGDVVADEWEQPHRGADDRRGNRPLVSSPPRQPSRLPSPSSAVAPWRSPASLPLTPAGESTSPAATSVVIDRIEIVTPPAAPARADPLQSLTARREGRSHHRRFD